MLVVSGGHTSLYLVPEPGVYRLIGRTRDDAAGEAYDKVAKLLGLGYPGWAGDRSARARGPRRSLSLSRDAADARRSQRAARDRRRSAAADVARRTDFSFSGLKTAVLRLVQERTAGLAPGAALPAEDVADICASFQRVVVEALARPDVRSGAMARRAERRDRRRRSANSRLRADAEARGARAGLPVFVPPIALSTDNAAMIGAAGLRRYRAGIVGSWEFNAEASLPLTP